MAPSPPRLVEVWAGKAADRGRCGSGWVLGDRGVLTAVHVVDGATVLQVRLAGVADAAAWVDAEVRWRASLDLAVLEIVPSDGQQWEAPAEPSPRLAAVGTRAIAAEAIGFPDATERPDGLRRPDHAPGTLLPSGAGRDHERLMALDVVDATVPGDAALWKGFSGAAVRDEHDRVVAVVVKVHPDRQQRRLLVVSVEDAASDGGFSDAGLQLGFDPVVEDRLAPTWRANVVPGSRSAAGTPVRPCELKDLSVFGVHVAVAPETDRDPFGPYVDRVTDGQLDTALNEAAGGGRRAVLVVGDSAAGKSRCAAEALLRHKTLNPRPLVVPETDRGLRRLLDQGLRLDRTLVWLDDLDKYLARGLDPELLQRLLDEAPDVVLVMTIRRSQLQSRQEGLADPAWRFLTDDGVIHRVEIEATFEAAEMALAHSKFSDPLLLSALDRGVGLGEYLVGGPELRKRLEFATGYSEHLANTVIAWYRTGLGRPIAESDLRRLWAETLPEQLLRSFGQRPLAARETLFREAAEQVCKPVISRDMVDIALVRMRVDGYEADDYIVDYVARRPDKPTIAQAVWEVALDAARRDDLARHERLWRVGVAAHDEPSPEVALSAMQALAELGDLGATVNVGVVLGALGRSEDAVRVYDDVVARFGEDAAPAVREQVARALFNKGVRLGALERSEDAVRVYEDVVARFGEDPTPGVREQAAMALFNKGVRLGEEERSEEELGIYDDVVARFGEDPAPAVREQVGRALFNKGVRLGALERSEEELGVYDDVVARFGEDPALGVREQVARALVNKGVRLGALGRSEDAVRVYDDVVARFGEDPAPGVREQVAKALVNKGVRLGALERSEEELGVYDDVVARFGEDPALGVREQVARALVNKGITLGALERSEDAVRVYDDVVARFGEDAAPGVREQVARALVNNGVRLGALGRSEDAVRVYDDVVARFGEDPAPGVREQVARALVNTGVTLGALERSEEELGVYDDVVARFGEDAAPGVREQVARALFNKGVRLGALERSEDAVRVYDDVVARFGEDAAPGVREQAAKALVNKGVTLGEQERSEEELGVYDDVVARFGEDPAPGVREQAAMALVNKGVTFGALERSEDAVRVYDDVVARFGEDAAPGVREQAAMALFNKGVRLGAQERSEDAVRVYDDVVARFGEDPTPGVREQAAKALVNKGITLGALERSEEELGVYDDVVARFGEDPAPGVREQAAMALVNKGVRLGALERSEDAMTVYDDLIARLGPDLDRAERDELRKMFGLPVANRDAGCRGDQPG